MENMDKETYDVLFFRFPLTKSILCFCLFLIGGSCGFQRTRADGFPDDRKTRSFAIDVPMKDVLLIKEKWPPFEWVLETKDGLRIPLAGPVRSDNKTIHFDEAVVSIEVALYDLRKHHQMMAEEKRKTDEVLGWDSMFQYVEGIPNADFNWYVVVRKLTGRERTFEFSGSLERQGLIFVK